MRSPVVVRLSKALSLLCAAVLCCSLIPTTALASQRSLSLIPEGEQGTVRIPSGAEGGALDTFSHCASYGTPSVDADGAVTSSENVVIEQDGTSADAARVSEDVPLVSTSRGYEEVDLASFLEGGETGVVSDIGTIPSIEERGTFYAEERTYQVVFDANGGSYAPEDSAENKAAFGGPMPDISRYLVHVAGKVVYPTQDKYVFMGWYDGSDWTRATKYYNKDFGQDDTCQKTYPYPADGLKLYAGWAPVLSYTVPTSVSIAIGTVPELGAPTADAGVIANHSPWPVRCTTLTWDDTEIPVTEDHLLATEAKVSGLLAQAVKMSAGTLDAMFSSKEGVYLEVTTDSGVTGTVQPGGTDVLGAERAIELPAAATDGTPATLGVSYTISLAQGVRVTDTEKVSTTTLVTPFEAVIPEKAASSCVMFNANGGEGGQSSSLSAIRGSVMPALTDAEAPAYEGRDFMGWFDSPDWTKGTRYYDADGRAIDDEGDPVLWDKDAACVLYAGWRAKGCSVTFIAGPSGSTASMEYGAAVPSKTYTVPYGTALGALEGFGGTLPSPFWKSEYAFLGWYDDEGRPYGSDFVATDYANPLMLTARWSGYPVTVTWNVQGGSAVEAWTTFPSGALLGSYGSLPAPVRAGYSFCGWWSAADTGTAITESTLVTADAEYYAHWEGRTITLSWIVDATTVTSTQTYGDGATVQFPPSVATPTKEGYTFEGFFDEDGAKVTTQTKLPTEDATFTARWIGKTITLAWDSHGGSSVAPTTQTLAPDAKVALPAAPTKEGYAFAGWYADDSYTSEVTASTNLPTHDVTYHAKWTGKDVTITWDSHGGTAVSGTIQKCDEDLVLPTQPTRAGYSFAGWWTGETTGSQVGATTKVPTGDVIYHARWSANEITLSWNSTGGSTVSDTKQTYSSTAKLTLPGSDPTYAGFTFKGWYTAASGGTQVTASTSLPSSNTTYYAQWTAKTITLTWAKNDGSGANHTTTSQTYATDAKVGLPGSNPTRTGYTFGGWYTAASNGTQVTASTALPTSNTTYHAHWTKNSVHTITLNPNGGSGGTGTIYEWYGKGWYTTSSPGDTTTATSSITAPTRAGYTFKGYATTNNATNGAYWTSTSTMPSNTQWSANATLYAVWSANTITLTWNSNGGSSVANTTQTFSDTAKVSLPGSDPTYAGFTFKGWYTAASGGTQVTVSTALPSSNTTYHAQWTANTITLTWAKNDGSNTNHTTTTQTYATDAKVGLPTSSPSRTGYTFGGWYTAASGGTQVTTSTALPTSNTTYHAHWAAKTSVLTFNANGGTGTMPTGKKATYGSAMPSISGAPTKAGYKFLGYYDAASGGTKYYNADLSSARNWDKDKTDGTTLYAQWTPGLEPTTTDAPPSGIDGDFYLQLNSAQATAVSTTKCTMKPGYYGAGTIKEAAKDISSNGTSSNYYEVFQKIMNNDYKFKGKWKNVDSANANSVLATTYAYDIRIIGLRQDYTNTNKTTFAGITFQFADNSLSYSYRFNNAFVNATGWKDSELRARMNSSNSTNCSPQPTGSRIDGAAKQSIWNRAPEGITINIQPVYKYTHNADGTSSAAVTATRDQFFLASYWEMASTNNPFDTTSYPWITNEIVGGTQYAYWKAKGVNGAAANASMVKKYCDNASPSSWSSGAGWWQRSAAPGSSTSFLLVGGDGNQIYYGGANDSGAHVIPCFCF